MVHIIGCPLDHGAGRRGVGLGPTALRIAGLRRRLVGLGFDVTDRGDIEVPQPESRDPGREDARYLDVVAAANATLAAEVESTLDEGARPIVIGGDHSMAIGTISGVAAHVQKHGKGKLGVLWFDAHADCNTNESSPSGNIHGMPVATLLGFGLEELQSIGPAGPKFETAHIAQVGLRDVDAGEVEFIRKHGIRAYSMADVDRRGVCEIVEEAIEHVLPNVDHLHVSFDIDVCDPRLAPGTGTMVRGGFTYREAHLALELVAERTKAAGRKIDSFELVEVNPILDTHNQTAEVGVGLIASALGDTIL